MTQSAVPLQQTPTETKQNRKKQEEEVGKGKASVSSEFRTHHRQCIWWTKMTRQASISRVKSQLSTTSPCPVITVH